MTSRLPYIAADAVHAALDYPSLIDALRKGFAAGATTPLRASHEVTASGDRLLVMPSWDGVSLGVKLVTVFPQNKARGLASVAALYVLMDGMTGHPLALVDGEALTLRRTSAASALASTYLSRSDASTLLVIGTGALAPYMARAHCGVRTIERVLIWGRSCGAANAAAQRLRSEGLNAMPAQNLQDAIAQAHIITAATTAREPLVLGEDVRPGTHVDLVGAFTPQMRESDDALVLSAHVFVDTYVGALKEAGDLVQPIESRVIDHHHVQAELAELVAGKHPGRTTDEAITLFKSVGTALEDLCAARLVVERTAKA
ncbi:MAG TPA: ornithine cyclodeaminase family protein [Casimicrobiaceae bacterium]|nr:ornithine cyclodeaminase family protein [Casimicrobiaceae bacterium]